jgi:hypothetical protein
MSPEESLVDMERCKKWKSDPLITLKKYLVRHTKSCAKTRGVEADFTIEDIDIPEECPILKRKFIPKHRWYGYSLDRVDNSKGYLPGNIKVISILANVMKNSATEQDLINFSENIINYIKK